MVNITFGRGRGLDPITNIIKISIRIFNVEISDEIYEMISSYFTFLFLGIKNSVHFFKRFRYFDLLECQVFCEELFGNVPLCF